MKKHLYSVIAVTAVAFSSSANAAITAYRSAVQAEASATNYYSFDSSVNAGPTVDLLGSADLLHDATVNGVVGNIATGGPVGSTGKFFDNISDGVNIFNNTAGNVNFTDETGTILLWFTHAGPGGNRSVVANRNDFFGTRFSIHVNSDNNTVGVFNGANFTTVGTSGIDVDDSQWHMLGIVFEGANTTRFVLDGVDLGTANGLRDGIQEARNEFVLGGFAGQGNGPEAWRGGIDEVSVHSNALSAAEIQTFYNTAIPEPGSAALLGLGGLALILRRRK